MRNGFPITQTRGSCIKRSSIPDQIGIGKFWFLRRGENWSTRRKTSWSRVENQQQTQPNYDAESRNRTRATLVEGECSHHCTIPAPHPPKINICDEKCILSYAVTVLHFFHTRDYPLVFHVACMPRLIIFKPTQQSKDCTEYVQNSRRNVLHRARSLKSLTKYEKVTVESRAGLFKAGLS